MKVRYVGLALVATFALGAGVGYYAKPAEIEIREVMVREVVEHKEIDTDKRRVITEERRPDGTVVRREEETDKTKIRIDSELREEIARLRREKRQPDWSFGGYYGLDRSYLLTVDRRIAGNLWVGVYGQLDEESRPSAGVGLRLTF